MKSLVFACVFLLLYFDWISGHDVNRINTLNNNLKNKIKGLREDFNSLDTKLNKKINREDFRYELYDTEEKIKAEVQSDLPDIIERTLFELLREGRIEIISRNHAQNEIRTLKQNVNQLKAGMLHLKRKLTSSDDEQRRQKDELKKIRRDMDIVVKSNTELNKQLTEMTCECGRELTSVATPTPVTVGDTVLSRLLTVNENGQFYQIDLKNYSKTTFPLKNKHIKDCVFNGATRSIIWANYSYPLDKMDGIYSMNINNNKIIPLVTGIRVFSLAVDNDLLFFGSSRTSNYINKMTITSKKNTEIASDLKHASYGFALDKIQRHLFSANYFSVLQMDYNGSNRRVVVRGTYILFVTFDPLTQALYYTDMNKVKKLVSESTRWNGSVRGEVVITLPAYLSGIVYYEDMIYTGDVFWHGITATNLTSISSKVLDTGSRDIFCLIP